MATIDSRQYYSTYFGHEPELLEALHEGLRAQMQDGKTTVDG